MFTLSVMDGLCGGAAEEGRYLRVKRLISFVRADVPSKIMGMRSQAEASREGLRALVRVTDTSVQKPIGFPPADDFPLIDLWLDPGELVVSVASGGRLMIVGSEEKPRALTAGEEYVTHLREGSYEVTLSYEDSRVEKKTVSIVNNHSARLDFTYKPKEPGTLSVTAKTAGTLSIREIRGKAEPIKEGETLTKKLPNGKYTVQIRYPDAFTETKTAALEGDDSLSLVFTHEIASLEGFVFIRGGSFSMGSPASEAERRGDEAQHPVTLNSFYIGKYEVTQKEYVRVTGKNPAHYTGDALPVESVSWFDAVDYCNARSQQEGLTPAYAINGRNVSWNRQASGYRLPTESEWEYACRAGSSGAAVLNRANVNATQTIASGSFAPNPWGLYDMIGNVWEWCWDWYGAYDTSARNNPQGAAQGPGRIVRGGGYYNEGERLRPARRGYDPPVRTLDNLGFRVVRGW
jgi:hypothetical protein